MDADITINDLASVVNLIDILTARGAFRGEELSPVGALRDKLAAHVKAAMPPVPDVADKTEHA